MITLGPYTFTETDARRTLANLGGMWADMMNGRVSESCDELAAGLSERLRVAVGAHREHDLGRLGALAGKQLSGTRLLEVALADSWTTLHEASIKLRADGQLPSTATGVVTQISSSKGGVPKLAMPDARIGFGGIVGDGHRHRNHHGRPWQALCIYSDEVIEMLQGEGHPMGRGSAGENITVSGLAWEQVRPGVELRIGTALTLVQAYAEPCASNAQWFIGGEFMRMHKSRGAVSRVYATVLEPGDVTTGDAIILEPGAPHAKMPSGQLNERPTSVATGGHSASPLASPVDH